jgi:hypothetical protein
VSYEPDADDPLTPREQRALALWRAPEPPVDLAARVVARLEAERATGGAARPLALAAVAAAVVAGLFALRLLSSGAGSLPGTAGDARVGDAGLTAEARPASDGVGS